MTPFDPLQELPPGTTLIEASAGTGKTYTITTLTLRLLLEQGLKIDEILVVTFTEAATAELQHRIRGRIRDALRRFESGERGDDELLESLVERVDRELALRRLKLALTGFDLAAISTIHGFCKRMLQENAFESGVLFDTELIADQESLLRELVRDFWSTQTHDASRVFTRYLYDRRVTPESLMPLAWHAADPDLPVLPEPSPPPSGPLDDRALQVHFERFRGLWAEHSKPLLAALVKLKWSLRGMDYFEDALRGHAFSVDDYVCTQVPHSPPESLRIFGSQRLLQAIDRADKLPANPLIQHIDAYLDACEQVEQAAGGPAERLLRLRRELVEHVRERLPQVKRERNLQSFDDLLHQLRDALRDPKQGQALASAISTKYRAALIDEFQDTDPVQYEIFKTCFASSGGHLFLIGDPKQAIYAFRGADVFAYMQAVDQAGPRAFTLGTNWRSDPSLIQAVNQLFSRLEHPFVFEPIGFQPVDAKPLAENAFGGAALRIQHLPLKAAGRSRGPIPKSWLSRNLPQAVAGDIARMLFDSSQGGYPMGDRELGPGDIAVLVRTNKQALETEGALRALGIPSVRQGDSSVLDSHEAVQLERLMAAVADPGDRAAVRACLGDELMGMPAHSLAELDGEGQGWDALVERFQQWKSLWEQQSFVRMFRDVLEKQGLQAHLLSLVDGERRLTNLLHLVELLHSAALEQGLGVLGLLRWVRLERESTDVNAGGADARKLRLESDAHAVQIVTIHKSKGLEYPVVFCPYLWDARLSGPRDEVLRYQDPSSGRRTLDIGSAQFVEHRALQDLETRAEDMRLLYVALTRARHRCVLYWGPFRNHEISPLGALLHQPSGAGAGVSSLERSTQAILALNDGRMRSELDSIAQLSQGCISVQGLDLGPAPLWREQEVESAEITLQEPSFTLDNAWRIGSFSRLAHGDHNPGHGGHTGGDHSGSDHDAHQQPGFVPPEGEPVTLLPFPRGARAGTFFHDILEHLDFESASLSDLDEPVERALGQHGYSQEWREVVCQGLHEILHTPFDGPLRLCDLPRKRRLDEMQFTFPIAYAGEGGLTPERLADCIQGAADPGLPQGYAERVRGLGFPELRGFLTGFIDLIYLDQGRWYLVDYKSNHLGDTSSAYLASELPQAMAESNYVLQYLIYSVALHRYLQLRLPGYSFEQNFGGAHYLYLKGMRPEHGASAGVFSHRPSERLVMALDRLFSASEAL